MQTKFKRRDKIRLTMDPDPEYIEYHTENTGDEERPIKKGMLGEINIVLPNGQYHVRIFDDDGNEFAYVMVDEDSIEAVE
jgi:hypothetical protein